MTRYFIRSLLVLSLGLSQLCQSFAAGIEIPTLQWGESKRPDGSTRYWNPAPVIESGDTMVCVLYRAYVNGKRMYSVGMTPPKMMGPMLANTKPELDECHRHGIKVIGYADCIMFHPDMFEGEGVNVEDLYGLDQNGKRVINTSWDPNVSMACFMNPEWVRLQKEVVRLTAQAGFDGLQFDVYPYAIAPGYLCTCHYCQAAWQAHSKKVFGSAQPMPGLKSGKLDYRQAVDRDFRIWRLQNFVDYLKSIENHVHKNYPKFILIQNHAGGTPDFTYEASHGGLSVPSTELWHLNLGEDSSLYLYTGCEAANGTQSLGLINNVEQEQPFYRYRVGLAEAFAGGGSFYFSSARKKDSKIGATSHEFIDFLRQHEDWMQGTRPAADVGILYSWRNQIYLEGDPEEGAGMDFDVKRVKYQRTASILARMGVPADCLLVEKGLSAAELRHYKIIIAPDLSLVSDKDGAALKKYVSAGGRLLVVGDLGTHRESGVNLVKRDQSLLNEWTGRTVTANELIPLGKGVITYAAKSISDKASAEDLKNFKIQVRPLTPEFRSACDKVELDSQLKVKAASDIETTVRAKGDKRIIHLIRFGDPDAVTDKTVSVDFTLPKGYTAKTAGSWASSPENPGLEGSWKVAHGHLMVELPRLDNYAALGFTLEPTKK